MQKNTLIIDETIENKIYNIRGLQVMIDRDLALLYGVETRALKQAIKRNIQRFPEDFMFILSDMEINIMVSQNVIPSKQHLGGSKPYAFTEQGVSMLSAVLKSKTAITMSIKIIKIFVSMKNFLIQNASIFQRLDNDELYNIGASLKDIGKKWFAFSKLDISSIKPMIEKLD